MASHNSITLVGRVVGPPEMRYTPGGKAVTQFAIAVDRRGNREQKETDFIPIVAWEKLAEICNQYLEKGKLVMVAGRLQVRNYETQDGQKRKAFDVVIHEMQMLSNGQGGGGERREQSNQERGVRGSRGGWDD